MKVRDLEQEFHSLEGYASERPALFADLSQLSEPSVTL